jgi:hypothetical protein
VLTIERIFRTMTERARLITMPLGPDGATLHDICESIRADRDRPRTTEAPVDRPRCT